MSYYDDQWEDWRPRTPPSDPRGPHHQILAPDPEFVSLCADAERAGLMVGLRATSETFGEQGGECRRLASIDVGLPERETAVFATPILPLGLGHAAGVARQRIKGLAT